MTPKKKANELFYKFNTFNSYSLDKMCCKKSAEYLCDEIIFLLDENEQQDRGKIFKGSGQKYWEQVKDEIDKICQAAQ